MQIVKNSAAELDAPVLELIQEERKKALSLREWKFRLAGYGLAIKEVAGTQIVTKLPAGTELGILPSNAV